MNANFGAAFLTSSPHASKNIIMVAGTAITLAVAVSYYQKKRVPKEKEEDSWLDSEGYEVVESICDTFLPEITLVGNGDLHLLVKETLRDEFNLSESNMSLFESNEVMSHKAHLLRGALSSNVPQQVKKAVQNLSYKREQQRVFQFVKILSYSGTYTHVYLCIPMYTYTYLCIPLYTSIYLYVPISSSIPLYIPLYLYTSIPIYLYIYPQLSVGYYSEYLHLQSHTIPYTHSTSHTIPYIHSTFHTIPYTLYLPYNPSYTLPPTAGCWLLFGIPTPFPKMSPVQRRQALLQLRDSSIGKVYSV